MAKVMRDILAIFRLLIVAMVGFLVFTTAVYAATEFDRQCQRLLPLADNFARKCLTEAVPFSRVHNKTGSEEFRVLFSDAYPNSHFIMGCMVDWQNQLRYVGMYYKTSTDQLPIFKSDQIGAVDYQANVGLDVAGRKQVLIAIHQFITDLIPARFNAVSNCEKGSIDGSRITENNPVVTFDDSEKKRLTYCVSSSSNACNTYEYKQYFETGHDGPIIAAPAFDSFFITANGGLIATDKYYNAYCGSSMPPVYGVEGIIQEICRPPLIPARTTKTVPVQSK
ncbi:hypothetical protein AB4Y96_09215 [Phyllobacterium sp. TAF24]|uniref:hypothetical protein n=1 Tax=Phyllobacterium sp. TAF24 TaxID=3233068 RepID=UPI003F99CC7A